MPIARPGARAAVAVTARLGQWPEGQLGPNLDSFPLGFCHLTLTPTVFSYGLSGSCCGKCFHVRHAAYETSRPCNWDHATLSGASVSWALVLEGLLSSTTRTTHKVHRKKQMCVCIYIYTYRLIHTQVCMYIHLYTYANLMYVLSAALRIVPCTRRGISLGTAMKESSACMLSPDVLLVQSSKGLGKRLDNIDQRRSDPNP